MSHVCLVAFAHSPKPMDFGKRILGHECVMGVIKHTHRKIQWPTGYLITKTPESQVFKHSQNQVADKIHMSPTSTSP